MKNYAGNTPGPGPAPKTAGSNIVEEKLSRAIDFHRQGNLVEARKLYEDILNNNKTHVDALHLLGLIHHQTKNHAEAERLYSKAIRRNPNFSAAHSNYGNTLQELKRFDEAVASYNRAIALKPDDPTAHSNRGVTLTSLNRYDEALASNDSAIALNPNLAEAHSNRGNTLQEVKRFDEAVASYDRAIAIRPDYAEAHYNRGNALHALERFNEALASHDRAIALAPDIADPYYNRGMTLYELKLFQQSIASYDRAIELRPEFAQAHSNRGNALFELGRFDEALASHDRAIALAPDLAEAYTHRGSALRALGRCDEALASHDRAIALTPDFHEAHSNRGLALHELGRPDEALASYDRAIAIEPEAKTFWNKSLTLLLSGDFENGWQLYEQRWKVDDFPSPRRNFKQPLWLGVDALQGRTILLHAEQGLGDAIQFCRYAELVASRGARVIVEAQRTLIGLFQKLAGVSELIAQGDTLPAFDFHCPLLSLPLALKTDLATIPGSHGYLRSEVDSLAKWQSKLGAKTKRRIGIAWSGSTSHKNDRNRSIPLASLIANLPDRFEYVSLQKDLRETDRQALEGAPGLKHFGDDLNDFTDTAALCNLMDIVVSVDTSVAHLSGALGKPTWVLLPYVPDWRWLMDRDDSPWYASLRLFRQEVDRNWDGVLRRVSQQLDISLQSDPAPHSAAM